MLSSCWCPFWRSHTSRGELNPRSSDQLTSPLLFIAAVTLDSVTAESWHIYVSSSSVWFPAQDKISFTRGRRSVFLSNSVNMFCIGRLIVKPSRWTHWSAVLRRFGSAHWREQMRLYLTGSKLLFFLLFGHAHCSTSFSDSTCSHNSKVSILTWRTFKKGKHAQNTCGDLLKVCLIINSKMHW